MRKSKLFAKISAVVLATATMFSTMTVAFAEDSTVTDKPKVELIIDDEKDSMEIDQEYYDAMIEHYNLIAGTGKVCVAPADEMTISFELNVDASEVKSVTIYKNEFFYTDLDGDIKLKAMPFGGGLESEIMTIYEQGECSRTYGYSWPGERTYDEPIDFLGEKNSIQIDSNGWYTIWVTFQDNSGSIWWVVPEDYEYKNYSIEETLDICRTGLDFGRVYCTREDNGEIYWVDTDKYDVEELMKFKFSNIKLKEDEETVNPSPEITEEHIIDLTKNGVVSVTDFEAILKENETKDVVIKSNNNVTFTFAKGTMKAVEGMTSYDFTTTINNTYKSDLPSYVTKDNFVSIIDYSYSGKLPAQASITIPVGKEYAGKTLYYSLMRNDIEFADVQAVKVNEEGYITVTQDHCSSYAITNVEPKEETTDVTQPSLENGNNTNNEQTPDTGDNTMPAVCIVVAVLAMATVVFSRKVNRA